MHLQQTKIKSRKSGGPQYWLQNPTEEVRTYLHSKRAVPVALMTPYGITKSDFMALDQDFKLQGGKVVRANAQHNRIQQAKASASIGEEIRRWFALPTGHDFERIDIEIEVFEGRFYLTPLSCKFVSRGGVREIGRPSYPLSFNTDFQSQLWKKQLRNIRSSRPSEFKWALAEIRRIVGEHQNPVPNIKEEDLLRASGPLNILGVQVGAYVNKGFDCQSLFTFLSYSSYEVPIEVKKRSSGFKYQQKRYGRDELSRAVILCMEHDHQTLPKHIDVVELRYFMRPEAVSL